jgi:RNA polymerase sigma factor (sigma-70 family)
VHHTTIVIPDELVRSASAGDPTALAGLWAACAPLVSATVRAALRRQRAIPSTLETQDVAQEAALLFLTQVREAAAKDGARFREDYARALYWRVHAYLRAERRRLGRQVVVNTDGLEEALRRRASGASGGPAGRPLDRALARLSPRQRAVIAGLYARDASAQSLARELGITPQAVTALHRRALATLRAGLELPDEDQDGASSDP